MEKYSWSNGAGANGTAETFDEAYEALQNHVEIDLDDAWEAEGNGGQTAYYYRTEEEMDADTDGAYTPQITEEDAE